MFLCAAAAFAAPPSGFEGRVEALRKQIGVPGMAIAIVENDKVTLAKGFGVKRLGAPEPVERTAAIVEGFRVVRLDDQRGIGACHRFPIPSQRR